MVASPLEDVVLAFPCIYIVDVRTSAILDDILTPSRLLHISAPFHCPLIPRTERSSITVALVVSGEGAAPLAHIAAAMRMLANTMSLISYPQIEELRGFQQ